MELSVRKQLVIADDARRICRTSPGYLARTSTLPTQIHCEDGLLELTDFMTLRPEENGRQAAAHGTSWAAA